MVGTDHTSDVEEANDDEADSDPAREADRETLEVKRKSLLRREGGVWLVSHGVDVRSASEFFAKTLAIVLLDVVVPGDVQPAAMSAPVHEEQGAPDGHQDREESGHGAFRGIEDVSVAREDEDGEKGGNQQPSLEMVHPFEVDGDLVAVVLANFWHVDEHVGHLAYLLSEVTSTGVLVVALFDSSDNSGFGEKGIVFLDEPVPLHEVEECFFFSSQAGVLVLGELVIDRTQLAELHFGEDDVEEAGLVGFGQDVINVSLSEFVSVL